MSLTGWGGSGLNLALTDNNLYFRGWENFVCGERCAIGLVLKPARLLVIATSWPVFACYELPASERGNSKLCSFDYNTRMDVSGTC